MKDILVLVTLQPLLRAIQKYILEEDRARVDIQYCKNLNGIIDFIDKKTPKLRRSHYQHARPVFLHRAAHQEENTYSSAGI